MCIRDSCNRRVQLNTVSVNISDHSEQTHEPETQPSAIVVPNAITVNRSVNREVPATSDSTENVMTSRTQAVSYTHLYSIGSQFAGYINVNKLLFFSKLSFIYCAVTFLYVRDYVFSIFLIHLRIQTGRGS